MLYVVGRTVPVGIKITASACEKSLTENSSSDFFFVSSGDIVYFQAIWWQNVIAVLLWQ